MQISLSTQSIFGLSRPKEGVNRVKRAGFDNVMLDLGSFYSVDTLECHGNIHEKKQFEDILESTEQMHQMDMDRRRLQIEKFVTECISDLGCIDIVHAPRLNWSTKRTDLNALMLKVGKDSIEVCENAKCSNIVIQPLFSGIRKTNIWRENHWYFLELGKIAQQRGICILLENQCGYVNGHYVRGVCSDAAVAAEWIDVLNDELGGKTFGFCLDIGAGNLCGLDMREVVVTLGKRVDAVLIRECDMIFQASRLPFTGRNEGGGIMDWNGLIMGLRKTGFDGMLIMDAGDTIRGFSHLLYPQLYLFMKSVADYLMWQINMENRLRRYSARVLFGAGKMCRNYMEYYGKQYPPIFICDNNPTLWEEKIGGVEIKSPEALHSLSEECAVIICNTFYEEIAEQLKNMGIKNVEAFSDEYLYTSKMRERDSSRS